MTAGPVAHLDRAGSVPPSGGGGRIVRVPKGHRGSILPPMPMKPSGLSGSLLGRKGALYLIEALGMVLIDQFLVAVHVVPSLGGQPYGPAASFLLIATSLTILGFALAVVFLWEPVSQASAIRGDGKSLLDQLVMIQTSLESEVENRKPVQDTVGSPRESAETLVLARLYARNIMNAYARVESTSKSAVILLALGIPGIAVVATIAQAWISIDQGVLSWLFLIPFLMVYLVVPLRVLNVKPFYGYPQWREQVGALHGYATEAGLRDQLVRWAKETPATVMAWTV
jgi:hypothetical protein